MHDAKLLLEPDALRPLAGARPAEAEDDVSSRIDLGVGRVERGCAAGAHAAVLEVRMLSETRRVLLGASPPSPAETFQSPNALVGTHEIDP